MRRYTDFMVNEIMTTREVVHLRSLDTPRKPEESEPTTTEPTPAPKASEVETQATKQTQSTPAKDAEKPAEFKVSEEDQTLLEEYFGDQNTAEIIALHKIAMAKPKGRPSEFGNVTVAVSDRDLRTKIHQAIRRRWKHGNYRGEQPFQARCDRRTSQWPDPGPPNELGRTRRTIPTFHHLQGEQGHNGSHRLHRSLIEDEPQVFAIRRNQG